MAGQPIGICNRLSSSWDIFRAYRKGEFGNAVNVVEHHKRLVGVLEEYVGIPPSQARILDLGCGQMARQVALFTADGANITGIDTEVPTYGMNPGVFLASLKQNGFERAAKSLARHLLFDGAFVKNLAAAYGKPVSYSHIDCRIMSATSLQFPDEHFDFIFSDWVFEHIEDVTRAVQELNRVLKKTGIARVTLHLFPSLSGGHHLDWSRPDAAPSKRVPPWDHLLENTHPANAYLNKLRLGQYRRIFHNGTRVIGEQTAEQGANVLDEALFAQLSAKGYTREDLLTYAVTFLCRKK